MAPPKSITRPMFRYGEADYDEGYLNFQFDLPGNLGTETAKRLARPLAEYMRAYVVQLEAEVKGSGDRGLGIRDWGT